MTRHVLWIVTLLGCVAPDGDPGRVARPRPADDTTPTPRTWRPLEHEVPNLANGNPGSPTPGQMMTDGTVVFADSNTNVWWRLTPDEFGGYEHGTWDRIKDGPADYAPLYYGSATLPDGRLVVEGGEYNFGSSVWTKQGAIYDPVANTWTTILPPLIFTRTIGDASSVVLDDGTFLLSDCCTTLVMATLDPVTLTWTTPVGSGKAELHDEESWAKLWDGRIITTDARNAGSKSHAEIYDPKTQLWTSDGDLPVLLADVGSQEVGPELTRLDGKVVAIGATNHNALYDPTTDTWTALPDIPEPTFQSADGPGAVLPNGDVLVAASPGVFQQPTHWYELHDTTFTHLTDEPENAQFNSSFNNFLIVLPTGEVLLSDFSTRVELYTPEPGFPEEVRPVIIAAPQLVGQNPEPSTAPITTLYRGRSYTVPVKRMNGVTFGAYYGDDAQMSTNFPLVRLTNSETGHVKYCRTYGHSDRSISPDEVGSTVLDIPATAEPGLSTFEVVANGIPSPPITVNIK